MNSTPDWRPLDTFVADAIVQYLNGSPFERGAVDINAEVGALHCDLSAAMELAPEPDREVLIGDLEYCGLVHGAYKEVERSVGEL